MKKITLLLVGLMASGAASAASVAMTTASTSVGNATCTLLNENVAINLSSNVVGAVECLPTGISIAACHTAGRTASRTMDVTTCVPGATATDAEVCTTALAQAVSGAAVAYATTAKGTVAPDYPGVACDAAAAAAVGVAAKKVPKL